MQLQVSLTRYETEACPSGGLCAPSTTQAVISGCDPILKTFEVFAVVCGGIAVVGLPQLPEMPEALVSVKFGVCMSLSVANIQCAIFLQAVVPLAFACQVQPLSSAIPDAGHHHCKLKNSGHHLWPKAL